LLVAKKSEIDYFITSAMSVNDLTEENNGILLNIQEYTEVFSGRHIFLMIYIHSGYNLNMLNENIREYVVF
jgi:hypothetical protein